MSAPTITMHQSLLENLTNIYFKESYIFIKRILEFTKCDGNFRVTNDILNQPVMSVLINKNNCIIMIAISHDNAMSITSRDTSMLYDSNTSISIEEVKRVLFNKLCLY